MVGGQGTVSKLRKKQRLKMHYGKLTLRDVAGMLRSFDYVAGSWERLHPDRSAAAWAAQARAAFLDGYAYGRTGRVDPHADERAEPHLLAPRVDGDQR